MAIQISIRHLNHKYYNISDHEAIIGLAIRCLLNNEYYNTSKSTMLSYASGFCPASQPFLASALLDPKRRLCAASFERLRQSLQINKKRFVVPTKRRTVPLPSLVKIENIILLHGTHENMSSWSLNLRNYSTHTFCQQCYRASLFTQA